MSAHFTTPTDELLLLAETLGEVKTKADKLEAEFATQARPLEAATNALSAALSGIKALQFHVLDNNLGALSARVEEMRKAVDEQVGVIALELKKADETNAAKAGQEAEALRSQIAALQAQLGTLGAQFSAQLERVEFSAKEEAKKLQLIPGPAGAAGASLNPRGTFIDGETYNRLDVVSWLGSSYIAAVDGVTEKPSKNSNQWQVLASRGSGGSGGAGDFGSLAGVAQINQGGTGQTTRAAGLNALLPDQAGATQYMLLTDGAGNVSWGAQPVAGLPSQTSNSGKLLTTNGTSASWSNAVTVSGNNATVTGTLTSNSTLSTAAGLIAQNADFNAGYIILRGYGSQDGGLVFFGQSANNNFINSNATTISTSIAGSAVSNNVAAGFRVLTTTASTTTSTGALVVSGGVGVAGAIVAGGTITSTASTDSGLLQLNLVNSSTGTSASSLFRFNAGTRTASLQAYNDTHATLAGQLRVSTSNGDIVVIPSGVTAATFGASSTTIGLSPSSTDALFSVTGTGTSGATKVVAHLENNFGTAALNNAAQLRFKIFNNSVGDAEFAAINGITDSVTAGARTTGLSFLTGQQTVGLVERMRISGAGVVSITSSAISSNTSSGALVVSGGVGVAGNTVVGGASFTTGDGSSGPYLASSSVIDHSSGQARFYGRGANTSTRATLGFYSTYSDGTGGITLQTFDVSGNATFGASIKTSAPSGGTAAAWKLGTVATVSPTSPNRTIEVDIGGTIYYIHAKTTNN